MRETTLGELRVRIAGGTDREGGGDGPVVVLMHGFGAPGEDLVGLWRVLDLPREVRFVFPEAPMELPGGLYGAARAWWMIDLQALERARAEGRVRDRRREHPEGLEPARRSVIAMLDALERELGVESKDVVLGGFSQGSMLALDVALHDARPLAGLVLLSCTLLAEDDWVPRMASRRGLPVLQTHGEQDELLAFELAEQLRDRMREAGMDVTWVPFRGGHGIPGPALDALQTFLARTCG
ncbi:MAG: alpha/beta hydrolase [Myxococcota bacterium]